MSGAVSPLPYYAFRPWCSVKSTGTTLPYWSSTIFFTQNSEH